MKEDNTFKRLYDVRAACVEEIGINGALILGQVGYWLEIIEKQGQNDSKVRDKHFIGGRWWIYNTFDQWHEQFPYWSIPTIKREFKKLTSAGILITGCFNSKGYDRTKWYTIDRKKLESLINTHSIKMQLCENTYSVSKYQIDTISTNQNNTIDSIKMIQPIPKNTTENTTENNKRVVFGEDKNDIVYSDKPMNYQILKAQITKACSQYAFIDEDLYYRVVEYFMMQYRQYIGSDHPRLKQDQVTTVIEALSAFDTLGLNEWKKMIDKYFNTDFDCDYRINHFVSKEILNNRFYEVENYLTL